MMGMWTLAREATVHFEGGDFYLFRRSINQSVRPSLQKWPQFSPISCKTHLLELEKLKGSPPIPPGPGNGAYLPVYGRHTMKRRSDMKEISIFINDPAADTRVYALKATQVFSFRVSAGPALASIYFHNLPLLIIPFITWRFAYVLRALMPIRLIWLSPSLPFPSFGDRPRERLISNRISSSPFLLSLYPVPKVKYPKMVGEMGFPFLLSSGGSDCNIFRGVPQNPGTGGRTEMRTPHHTCLVEIPERLTNWLGSL